MLGSSNRRFKLLASNILASNCIRVTNDIHIYYVKILAGATGGEPHLDLTFAYTISRQFLSKTKVVRRCRFADCRLGNLHGFIREQEYMPMEFVIDSQYAEQARVFICNLIFFLVHRCWLGVDEPMKSLLAAITVEVWGRKKEEGAEFLCERRISRVLSYVYSGGRGSSPDAAEKEGGGIREEEICAVCLDGGGGGAHSLRPPISCLLPPIVV